uniref:ATP synthase F0 subunit 8 n=1 Tax=Rhynchothorax sp. JZ-2022 TaxID=2992009 RepID=A0A9E8ADU1_9CHEL|nr:ATP synthase F0 subunit 8 [Rhynchothorax sp. JZ-2022]
MPQMMPLNWMLISFLMLLIILMIFINVNFTPKPMVNFKKGKKLLKKNFWQW